MEEWIKRIEEVRLLIDAAVQLLGRLQVEMSAEMAREEADKRREAGK